ncbi:MAG: hypothetical protein LBG77_05110 [Dysgonamonadaceae bacterium]|jgi:hypothetical protein|nr:hypothetical protein [Dysgonamonadaceae bacterium]
MIIFAASQSFMIVDNVKIGSFINLLNMKVIVSSVLLFCISILSIVAQDNNIVQVLSPEVAAFTKYGNYPINLYRGAPEISIPLYEINESGFQLPIYLQYDATGVLPNKDASMVGQNWTLVAGGVITRQVRGIPDDCYEYYPAPGTMYREYPFDTETYGYWVGLKQRPNLLKSQEYLLNVDQYLKTSTARSSLYCDIGFEHEPDLFTISAGGQSLQFMIANDGSVKVFGNKTVKVDLTGLSIQRSALHPQNSSISVTMEDGYKYIFGGNTANLEIYYPIIEEKTPPTYYQIRSGAGIINAWYLSEIVSPNQQHIYFTYRQIEELPGIPWTNGDDYPNMKKNIAKVHENFDLHTNG